MVYGVLLLIKMKNSSTSSRSRSSSRSSSRATSPVRNSVSNSALAPVQPLQIEDRGGRLSSVVAPTSLVREGSQGAATGITSQSSKTKEDKRKKTSCSSNTSQHTSRRTRKPLYKSKSASASSSRTGSPSGTSHRSSTSPAVPATGATLAAMTRDQRIRRWLQGLKQESLESSIPEEDIPGKEDSLEVEELQVPCESHTRDESSYPTRQSNGNESTPHIKGDTFK